MKRYLYGSELYENIQRVAFNKDMNLTVGRLCDSAGISRTTMSNLRNDKSTSLNDNTLMKLAKYLGVDVKELYTVEVPEEANTPPTEQSNSEFIRLMRWTMPCHPPTFTATDEEREVYVRKSAVTMLARNPYYDRTSVYTAADEFYSEKSIEELLALLNDDKS